MEGRFTPVQEVNGVNLDNYFPHQSSFNTVVYVHKKFLKKEDIKKEEIVKSKREVKKKIKEDKAVNCDIKNNRNKKEGLRNDSILHQTIRFAKDLVPLVIPPSEDRDSPVFYTIKTCHNCKKKNHRESKSENRDDPTFEKKKSKKVIEVYKKDKKNQRESSSRYSVTHSSQSNTLDDLNLNQSLCYTLSDNMSDKREKNHHKVVNYNNKRKRGDIDKFAVSESFEALATESNDARETTIKIQLMSDKEKQILSDNIGIPVRDTVRSCLKEFNNTEMREDVKTVQSFIKRNSQKLDYILEKLTCIEKHLSNTNTKIVSSPKAKPLKASRLEQLGEDLEEKEYSSGEELPKLDSDRNRNEIITFVDQDSIFENLGGGEISGTKASTSVGVKADRTRQPARFCWTDAARKN